MTFDLHPWCAGRSTVVQRAKRVTHPLQAARKPPYLILLSLLSMLGCGGDDLERQVVYGRVSFNGEQVTGGDILFVPIGDTKGPTTGAKINDGQYQADHRGGVPIGRHQIRVRGFLGELPPTPQGGPDNIVYPAVPVEFYTASTIEITLESGEKQVEKNFDLTTETSP